ncbi:BON domain-containing protein [Pedobacter paludis]|uniref:Ornithine aminotransferase n=1 Tax=Pedobacter paludis TaxID=2203212 RepID=A0A317EX93_9SPHI|nr:BON domain-containing protein [Pedobacter paludis]PWS30457.1 ornithine aminotransferase [Pedobacter paludis]
MKTDNQIQKDVLDELKWEPLLNAAEIAVSVKDGIVTLSGEVDSYSKKLAAEHAAKRISGVKAIAQDIQVGLAPIYRKTDAEIASAVVNALKWHTAVQQEKIKIKVEDGVVRLEGQVDWEFQKNSARTAIEHLLGVKSVINLITLKPRVTSLEISRQISSAFTRNAILDAANLMVSLQGDKVVLTGTVNSFAEKEQAEHAAWSAPGVMRVESHLKVVEPEFAF